MRVVKGQSLKPPRIFLYGTEGIGKTTFASHAPAPIFIPTEDGLASVECDHFPIAQSYEEVLNCLQELCTEKHSYATVVIDSADWLEALIWNYLCRIHRVSNIEKVGGGFAKGYIFALDQWREILQALDYLRDQKSMITIFIAHSKIERFEDPFVPAYDRYAPRLHKHASSLLCEWADVVLFANRKFLTQKEDLGFGQVRVIAHPIGDDSESRILQTVGSPACVAKNRYGLPPELPLSWQAFWSYMPHSKKERS